MSGGAVVLAVGGDHGQRSRLVAAITSATAELVEVVAVDDATSAVAVAERVGAAGGMVPIAFVDAGDSGLPVDAVIEMHGAPALAATRIVIVTDSASLRGIDTALRSGAVQGMLTRPWTAGGFSKVVDAHLATFLVEHAPDRLGEFDRILDEDDRARAHRRIELRRAAPAHTDDRPHPLLDTSSEDAELEAQLVDALDRALGHPPRIRVAPGTVMIEAGEDVGGIYVLLDGRVRLTSRTPTGEQILHEHSTGRIVGLLSLATKRQALLQCTAVTDVRAIPVTIDQLAHALDVEPTLSGLLNRVLIGSLARRLRRSDELQVELDQSLAALSEARAELVSAARLATLGELSAGLAHELNNPVAALVRSLDHIASDLLDHTLVAGPFGDAIRGGLAARIPSTAELRSRRREFAEALGDRRLAERIVDLGATSTAEATALAALQPTELDRVEAAARLGRELRDAASAARRVQALVGSLRAYARGDDGQGPLVPDVDVARTIRSALGLLQHRRGLAEIELRLDDVPLVTGRPGPLQAVWSNLLSNAIDALTDPADGEPRRGHLVVELDQPDGDHVRVRVTDDGPGVPPDLVDRIFEPRFTTKGGRVKFGMGLGLSISRQIVHEHGGTIEVDSRPGRTVFTVRLPIGGPS